MSLKYLNNNKKDIIYGPINWAMSTRGTRISRYINDFIDKHKHIKLNYKDKVINCHITEDSGSRTINWQNSLITKILSDKFGTNKSKYDKQSKKYNIYMTKISNIEYKIHFSFEEVFGESVNILNKLIDPDNIVDAREFINIAIALRQGQVKFRKDLIDEYSSRCAITNCDCEYALEAAHIYPFKGDVTNCIENGILLRADIHTLFDKHLLVIDDKYRVILHPKLRKGHYSDIHKKEITRPERKENWPSIDALAHHRKEAGF